jgi:hypothetical protein
VPSSFSEAAQRQPPASPINPKNAPRLPAGSAALSCPRQIRRTDIHWHRKARQLPNPGRAFSVVPGTLRIVSNIEQV